ncbi:DUF4397 domain-containing protein [Hazenella sp. IB182357]|uniref:DUF4397 domain-containing protein n=1 Tax=Polycladospora coralii TaxID=2771432 RepID=A0A926RUH1_9BACL|nr:DUF4397 domain-containing protein [Polycladospora coralii]MBD1372557.1 DUF4397 domain-containing protein [Polycladospora coralii]MBS7531320.1 DUF4397 domain-containing protein [Polycladospora coralii]
MSSSYLDKANMYRILAEYYMYRDPQRYQYYYSKFQNNKERFVQSYEKQRVSKKQTSQQFDATRKRAWIKFLHAASNAQNQRIDIFVNNELVEANVRYGEATRYVEIERGTYRVTVYPAGERTQPLVVAKFFADPEQAYMLTLTNPDQGTRQILQFINYYIRPIPIMRMAKVRFIHLASGFPAVDIQTGTGTPIFKNIVYEDASNYRSLQPDLYDLVVYQAGTNEKIASFPRVRLDSEQVITIVALKVNDQLQIILIEDLLKI